MMRTITGIAKRKKEKVEEEPTEVTEISPPPVSKELKRRWSYFIRKVYETDPLVCPKCSGEMRILSLCGAPRNSALLTRPRSIFMLNAIQ